MGPSADLIDRGSEGPPMPGHDIIVVGASAGGVEAFSRLVADLPAGLPASVFMVLHIPPMAGSALPEILGRRAQLPVAHAIDGEPIEPARIYVAPPNRHLMLRPGRVRVVPGPKENGHRPAVDPLFRSAAVAYGRRVVAVVLSGSLDDGTAGLRAVKNRGGVAVVQDPDEALYRSMPLHAVEGDHPDLILPVAEIGKALVDLAESSPGPQEEDDAMPDEIEAELDWAHPELEPDDQHPLLGRPSGFSCPECHGVLWELKDGELVRFRCRVGHGFSSDSLVAVQGDDVEAALWTAYRTLEERAALCRKLAGRASQRQHRHSARHFERQAADAEHRAQRLRGLLHPGTAPGPSEEEEDADRPPKALPGE
jgi:two-component system, chemotaxis family, protein-glutamate methylesterase/glutaminase